MVKHKYAQNNDERSFLVRTNDGIEIESCRFVKGGCGQVKGNRLQVKYFAVFPWQAIITSYSDTKICFTN